MTKPRTTLLQMILVFARSSIPAEKKYVKAGLAEVKTPNIDALADEGIVMDRFYATPWCAPSRGAIQSGRLDVINPNVPNNAPRRYLFLSFLCMEKGFSWPNRCLFFWGFQS